MSEEKWWEAAPLADQPAAPAASGGGDWWASAPLADAPAALTPRPVVPNAPPPDYSAAFAPDKGDWGDMLARAAVRPAELLGNLFELPVTASRALGWDGGAGRYGEGALLKGLESLSEIGTYPMRQIDAAQVGLPTYSGGEVLDAVTGAGDAGLLERLGVVGTAIPELGVQSIPDMAGALALFPYLGARTNEIADDRAVNDGRTQPTLGDVVIGGAAAIPETLLERFTTMRLLPGAGVPGAPGVVPALGRVAKEVGVQAPLGGLEELIAYAGTNLGTEAGATPRGAAENFVLGALAEGGIGGVAQGANEILSQNTPPAPAPSAPPSRTPDQAKTAASGEPLLGDIPAEDVADLEALLVRNLPPEAVAAAIDPTTPPPALQPKAIQTTASPAVQAPAEAVGSRPAVADYSASELGAPFVPFGPPPAATVSAAPSEGLPPPATPPAAARNLVPEVPALAPTQLPEAANAPADQAGPAPLGTGGVVRGAVAGRGDAQRAGSVAKSTPAGKPLDMLRVIAMGRGLDRAAFQAAGVDPAELTRRAGFGYVFRKNGGMTPSDLREWMQQEGYLPRDQDDRPADVEDNDALDLFDRAFRGGEEVFSYDQQDQLAAYQSARREADEAYRAEVEPDDDGYGAEIARLVEVAYDAGVGSEAILAAASAESDAAHYTALSELIAEANRANAAAETESDRGSDSSRRADQSGAPARQQTGLFPAATAREEVAAEAKRREESRNGLAGTGRTDMMAGDGELFAGPRPAQDDVPFSRKDSTDVQASGIPAGLPARQTSDTAELARSLNRWLGVYGTDGAQARFRAIDPDSLPDTVLQSLDALGAATGTRIVVVRNLTPEVDTFNGVRLPSLSGVLFVDETAQNPVTTVAAHEFTHQLEQDEPQLWQRLADEVQRQGRLDAYQSRLKTNGLPKATRELAIKELVGDAVGDAMADPDFLRALAERNPGVFKRVADAFVRFLDGLLQKAGLRSADYLADVQAFRAVLLDVMGEYQPRFNPTAQPTIEPPGFSRRDTDPTDTPAFRKWFGDSKVVDADGKPLVVYHGTAASFTRFNNALLGSATGANSAMQGHWFASAPVVADGYSHYAAVDALMRRKLAEADKAEKKAQRTGDWDEYDAIMEEAERMTAEYDRERLQGQVTMPVYLSIQNPGEMDAGGASYVDLTSEIRAAIRRAKAEGRDGLIVRNLDDHPSRNNVASDHFLAFSPTQIKSATGNNGEFDPANPSILFSRRDRPQAPAGDGSRSTPAVGTPDLRQADRAPLDNEPAVAKALRHLKEQVGALQSAMTGRVKNPATVRRRVNDVRAAMFDSIVSRARALEARNPNAPSLKTLFNQFMAAAGDSRLVTETVNDAIAARFAIFTNRARNILGNNGLERMTPADNANLRKAMLDPKARVPANVRTAATNLRKLMDAQREDLIAAGVDVGEVTDIGYLTRIYDEAKILTDEAGFLDKARTLYRDHEFQNEVGTSGRNILYADRAHLARFLAAARRAGQGDPAVASVLADIKAKVKAYRSTSDLQTVREIEALVDSIYPAVAQSYADVRAAAWLHKIATPQVAEHFAGVSPSAAPITKGRELSAAADTVMADYMKTDMLDILDAYGKTVARKVEHAARFGPKGEKIQALIDAARREGVPTRDLEIAATLVDSVTGQQRKIADSGLKSFADFTHAWGYLALLSKASFSSAMEAVTYALRTGDLRHTAAPLVQVIRAVTRSQYGKDLNAMALAIGVNGNKAVEDVLMNQLGGDYSMTPQWSRLLQSFFRATFLTPLTRAQRAYGVGAATGFLRHLSQNVMAGKDRTNTAALLNEVGIADHRAFAQWLLAQPGALPDMRTLFDENGRATPRGQDYMAAVRRIVNQSIQNPGAEHRPAWTNNPGGRLVTGIMSFSYASYENIIRREMKLARRNWTDGERGDFAKRGGQAIAAATALIVAQTGMSVLREMLFNAARFEDKDDEEIAQDMLLLGLSRTFGLGSADPIIQYITGLKYQRSAAETAVGAAPGLAFQTLDRLSALFTDRNSENTDTTEFRAAGAFYGAVITPAINAVLSRLPGGGIPIIALSDKAYRDEFAAMFGDKPEPKSKLDDDYQEAVKALEEIESSVEDRIGLLPKEQWAAELDELKAEYPSILAGVELDTYADNTANRNKGRAGMPKSDKGKPILKLSPDNKDEGSVLGELEGYPYWYKVGNKAKQGTSEGIQDRIRALNKAINNVRDARTATVDELVTFGRQVPGDSLPPTVADIDARITAGTLKPRAEATQAQRNAVLEELQELRRAEKRAALAIIEKGQRGERIDRTTR